MEEKNMSQQLINKLTELNELELNKSKVLAAIFIKTTREIMNKKIYSLESNIKNQAKFYDQKLSDYDEVYNEILCKYTNQLSQIINTYSELYVNVQMELQEAECNQKIAITNLKKSFDIKQEIFNRGQNETLEDYNKKISACLQKKLNYDVIIENCEKELEQCASIMESKINTVFGDKSSQISAEDENTLKKFINKLVNKFTGTAKFNTYVIKPTNIEMEAMDDKLSDLSNNIKERTIDFVAKIKQAKDETNKIFESMMN